MSESDHNGPGFGYRVYWKQESDWNFTQISNYSTKRQLVISNQFTYQQYKIKVISFNFIGECNAIPEEIIGYFGKNGNFIKSCYYYYHTFPF